MLFSLPVSLSLTCFHLSIDFPVALVTYYSSIGETPNSPIMCQVIYQQINHPGSLYLSFWKADEGLIETIHHSSCQTELTLPCHEEEVLAEDEWRAYDLGGPVWVCERGWSTALKCPPLHVVSAGQPRAAGRDPEEQTDRQTDQNIDSRLQMIRYIPR